MRYSSVFFIIIIFLRYKICYYRVLIGCDLCAVDWLLFYLFYLSGLLFNHNCFFFFFYSSLFFINNLLGSAFSFFFWFFFVGLLNSFLSRFYVYWFRFVYLSSVCVFFSVIKSHDDETAREIRWSFDTLIQEYFIYQWQWNKEKTKCYKLSLTTISLYEIETKTKKKKRKKCHSNFVYRERFLFT